MKSIFLMAVLAASGLTYAELIKDKNLLRKKLVSTAREFKGLKYIFGGNKIANGLDCSSFIKKVYSFYDIKLPRVAKDQYKKGIPVDRSNLKAGDLVFFQTYRPGASHVGIYSTKANHFIHAGSSRGVNESSLDQKYFADRYLGAKRIIQGDSILAAKTIKPAEDKNKDLFEIFKTVSDFQKKQSYIKKPVSIKKTKKVIQGCPKALDNSIMAYVYDSTFKLKKSKKNLLFGQQLQVVGTSEPISVYEKKLITTACVVLENGQLDLIDAKALSYFPPKDIIDSNCKGISGPPQKLKVSRSKTKLRLYNYDYENVFGNLVPTYKMYVKTLKKGEVVESFGQVSSGDRKGDYCISLNGNVVIAFEGDLK